jgi:PAS domain S-box-containing protein
VPEAIMLGMSLLVVCAVALLSYRSGEAEGVAEQQRNVAEEIVRVDASLLSDIKDAETGERGFLLTGQESYLAPYSQAVRNLPQVLQHFQTLTASQPDLAVRFRKIEPLVAAKLAGLKTNIDLRRENRLSEALAILDTNRGEKYMDEIRAIGGEIEQSALTRLNGFELHAQQSASNLRQLSIGGSALLAVFLVFSTITIVRGMARRDELFSQAYAGEKLLAATLEGIADGVIATDAEGRITFINPVAQKLTGWSEPEAVARSIQEVFAIVNESTRAKVDNPLEQALAQGMAAGLANHTNLISKAGVDVPIDDSAAPLKDEQGKIIGAVIVFRDISAKRRAETQLRNANQELQQFVDGAAHDLRSPLNSVNAMAQMLAERYSAQLGPRGQELIGYISGGTSRMKKLLDDLLAFARASHFDESTAPPVSLEGPFQEALENLKVEIERTGAKVTSEPLPVVGIQETHALQLFQNLIGNGIKYHGEEAPRIHIRTEQKNGEWVIAVADNGIGLEPEYLDQIFKPFKRFHSDEYPGSGIGLATCRKIVKGYDGRIWAESVPGKGSTFYVALPLPEERTSGAPASRGSSAA